MPALHVQTFLSITQYLIKYLCACVYMIENSIDLEREFLNQTIDTTRDWLYSKDLEPMFT